MKKILFAFILIIASISYSQNDEAYVNSIVGQKLAELEMQDNQEYFLRKDYCDGNIQMFIMPDGKRCSSQSTYYAVYVFWKEAENKMNVQKFDNCGSFTPFTIEMNKTMAKALNDKKSLKTEEVKPYKSEKTENNAYGNMSVQACHKDYRFILQGDTFEKNFMESDLISDSKNKNVNADHNKSLALIKLDTQISEVINYFEANGKFFREN